MSDPFLAEIRIVGFNFAPRGWAFCNGQILPIAQNTALFSLLGTTYGGNGTSTFALPNLIDRAAMHSGQGPGLTNRVLGEQSGSATVTLTTTEIPAHAHPAGCATAAGNAGTPINNIWAGGTGRNPPPLYQTGAANAAMSVNAVANNGGGQPHSNQQPFLGLNFVIALQGVFPPRS